MITAFIKGQAIETTESVIVAESLNYLKAQFVFITSDWNGLEKKAYFMQGDTTHSIELNENNIAFPLHLSAGEWAVSVVGREYADGELVERITSDSATIKVKPFKTGQETPFPEPTPTEIEALTAKVGNLHDLATNDKSSLVNALNEVYKKGGGGGGADGFSPIIDVAEIVGGHRITITDADGTESFDVLDGVDGIDGKDGENGKDGADGYTPIKGVDYFDGEKGDKGDPYTLTDTDKEEIKNAVIDEIPENPTKTSQLENDSGYITADDLPKGDFSQFIEQTAASVNLYAPTTEGFTDNAMITSNGTPTVNETTYKSYFTTPSLPVVGGKTYTVKPTPWVSAVQAKNRARTYDGNGTPLAVMTFTDNADGSSTFTVPDGSETIKMTILKSNFGSTSNSIDILIENFNNSFMFVEGTTAPEVYEPYGKGSYRLKDIEIPEKSVKLSKVDDETLPIFAPLAEKKIANFGDSIFGNARPPKDVSTFLAEKTGAEVLNCAFGGCRMGVHTGHWDAFSMYRLAYAIANNDYSLQEEALNHDDRTSYAEEPLALIKATDFSNVDIVTIGYGTNDFTGNNTLDNSENPLDTSTVGGALRYSIETLLTAFPNLRIVILSLTYRFWIDDSNAYTEDSNSRANSKGDTILDYNAKLKEVAEEYNLPFIDNYNIGIGKFNRYQYFPVTDGTHHNETGRKLIASHLAKKLY